MVYFDHNATMPMDERHRSFLVELLQEGWANPSSVHTYGRRARAKIEIARRSIAGAIGALPGEIVFTSGATEAIHLGLRTLVSPGGRVTVSAVEHPAVWGALETLDAHVDRVPVDGRGRIDIEQFMAHVHSDTECAILMGAQNEIGNVYPIGELASRLGAVPLFSDCVQALGKIDLNVAQKGLAAASFSGHKIGSLSGVGALWISRTHLTNSLLRGGPQERGRRAGTENVLGVMSFGHAVEKLDVYRREMDRVKVLRDRFLAGLKIAVTGVTEHGDNDKRLANTASFRVDGVPGDLLLQALDLEGFNVSSGSACSAGSVEPSTVLLAMGLSEAQAREGIRVSLGPQNTLSDVESLLAVMPPLIERIRRHAGEA